MDIFLIILGSVFSNIMIIVGVWIANRSMMVGAYRNRILTDKKYTSEERWKRLRKLPSMERMIFQLFRFDWEDYLSKETNENISGN